MTITELKKLIPMPTHCPVCGRELTEENANIDHILPRNMGGTDEPENLRYLCRECNVRRGDKFDPIFEYYYTLMIKSGVPEEHLAERIHQAMDQYSKDELVIMEERIKEKDSSYGRLKAYSDAIQKVIKPGASNELAEEMKKTLAAYESYDYASEIKEFINGNTFSYPKGFPIDQYRKELEKYGEFEQEEEYSVYLDDDGKLVVY